MISNNGSNISSMGERIFVSDMEESFHCLEYDINSIAVSTLAFDIIPRFITCASPLDYNTIAGGDKYGGRHLQRHNVIQSILMLVFLKICGIRVQHAKVFKK